MLSAIFFIDHFLFNQPQTLNFGGKYFYDFNIDDNQVEIKRTLNSSYIKNFFGNSISNVNVLIGENGTGKSVLLSEISKSTFFWNKSEIESKKIDRFLIFEEEDETILYSYYFYESPYDDFDNLTEFQKKQNRRIKYFSTKLAFLNDSLIISFDKLIEDTRANWSEKISFIRHDILSHFSNYEVNRQNNLFNSIDFLNDVGTIREIEKSIVNLNFVKHYKIDTWLEGLNFYHFEKHFYHHTFPNQFITDKEFDENIGRKEKQGETYYIFNHLTNRYFEDVKDIPAFNNEYGTTYGEKHYKQTFLRINLNVFVRLFQVMGHKGKDKYQEIIRFFIVNNKYEELKNQESAIHLFNLLESEFKISDILDFELFDGFLKFLTFLPNNLQLTFDELNETDNIIFLNCYEIIKKYWVAYPLVDPEKEDFYGKHFLYWSPSNPISDGETMILQLFNQIYNIKNQVKDVLILDEPDARFHPNWSKKLVNSIIKVLPIILNRNSNNKIQIIFSSHSPIVLSDIPKSNIIYLKREEGYTSVLKQTESVNRNTFGANIHDLLANEFFLEDGFIGAFAKNKIQIVIDNLRTDNDFVPEIKMEQEDIKNVIDVIGEPFLKEKLLEMYQQKFKEPDFYDKEIERLQLKIEEYKKRQKTKE